MSKEALKLAQPEQGPSQRDFENWLRSRWTAGYACPKRDGRYVHEAAQSFWECWQAATPPAAEQQAGGEVDEKSTKTQCLQGLEAGGEAPAQEPETCSNCANSVWPYGSCDVCTVQFDDPTISNWEPIVTPPAAQRTWVGLTDEELNNLPEAKGPWNMSYAPRIVNLARAIEAKLKEKNT
jgi:hypothetical protein